MTESIDLNVPSPIQKIEHPLLDNYGIHLYVKREDLIHPEISGNKWRKLKYNLLFAKENNMTTLATFGGPFSNHLYAFASACYQFGYNGIAFVRGEPDPKNPTTNFAVSKGVTIHYISRSAYREKEQSDIVQNILNEYDNYFLIPEGGSNEYAQLGLQELAQEINNESHDCILVSLGTGGTCRGLLDKVDENKDVWGFSSLKSDYHLKEYETSFSLDKIERFTYFDQYHFGGYGKVKPELIDFINAFHEVADISIDPIYNAKLVYGFFDQIKKGNVDVSKKYLWIHTGGLQGVTAYNYLASKKNKMFISKIG